jgi:sulfite reductase alpha subunit-like flavoprotein
MDADGRAVCCHQALDEYRIEDLPTETTALFVLSTTGDGEEPDNMRNFWRFLLRKSLPAASLSALRYGIFGLGDSSYPKFNAVARRLEVSSYLGPSRVRKLPSSF